MQRHCTNLVTEDSKGADVGHGACGRAGLDIRGPVEGTLATLGDARVNGGSRTTMTTGGGYASKRIASILFTVLPN